MITLTKTATMVWDNNADQYLPAIDTARRAYLATAVQNGETDGVATIVSPTETQRSWTDQTTVDAWSSFIQTTATDNGASVTVTITDI
jgi:hypothetical protein